MIYDADKWAREVAARLADHDDVSSARPFEDTGVLTSDAGVLVRMFDGSEYQIRIVQSKEADR